MDSEADCWVDVRACDRSEEANDDIDYDYDIDEAIFIGIVRVSFVRGERADRCGHEHQKSSGYKLAD